MTKEYVGILVDKILYKNIYSSNASSTMLTSWFEEGAVKNNLIPCYFRTMDIKAGKSQIRVLVKSYRNKWIRKTIPIPKVIYNQLWNYYKVRRKLAPLITRGIKVFNERNYLEKFRFQKILENDPELRNHVPQSEKLTKENLEKMMTSYKKLIIKPDNGFVSRGIMLLENLDTDNWCLSWQTYDQDQIIWNKSCLHVSDVPSLLFSLINPKVLYFMQNLLPLATYGESPFDMRVATQRNGSGDWEVTAIIGKVAQEGRLITNITQGGTSFPLATLLTEYPNLSPKKVEKNIKSLALKLAECFSQHTDHVGDLGFDIALTVDGKPYFIECNFLSAYKTLSTRNNQLVYEGWKAAFTTPMAYARYLIDNM